MSVRRAPDWRFLVTLALISLINPLSVHMYLPVLPEIKPAFGIPDALAGATFSITLLIMAAATLVYGSLSDRYGRRPVLLAGLFLFTLGSALSALAQSVAGLFAGRALQALGAGCGVTLSRAIARDAWGAERLVKIIAYLTMAYTLGPMAGPLIGGLLVDLSGWRSVFWFATLAGVLITAAAYAVLRETRLKEEMQQRGAGVLRDYFALFSHARFTAFVLQTGFTTGAFLSLAAASAFLMKDYLGRSATEFGLYFLLYPIGYLLGNLGASRLSGHVSVERMVVVGSAINMAAAAAQAAAVLLGHVNPLVIFVPGLVISVGQGLALANAQVGAIRVIPALSGTAAGIGVFFQMFLGAVFTQLYGILADGTPLPMVITVTGGSVLGLIAGVIPSMLKRGQRVGLPEER